MNIKDHVSKLLHEHEVLTDNDMMLIMSIYYQRYPESFKEIDGEKYMRVKDFYEFVAPESIRRARQLLQAENPLLRGKNYDKRQELGEETRQTINDHC